MFGFGRKKEPQPDSGGRLPAWYFAMEGQTNELKAALEQGLDPDHAGKDGMTMLFVAAHYGRTEAVRMLLAAGADPNRVAKGGNGPLWEATREASKRPVEGRPVFDREVVSLLLQAGADPAHTNAAGTAPAGWAQWDEELQTIYRDAGFTGDFADCLSSSTGEKS